MKIILYDPKFYRWIERGVQHTPMWVWGYERARSTACMYRHAFHLGPVSIFWGEQ